MAEESIQGPPYSGPASKPILDSVKFPSDMKKLSMSEIKQVRRHGIVFDVLIFLLPHAKRIMFGL